MSGFDTNFQGILVQRTSIKIKFLVLLHGDGKQPLHQRVEGVVCHPHENFEKLDAKSCIVSVSWRCFIALTED